MRSLHGARFGAALSDHTTFVDWFVCACACVQCAMTLLDALSQSFETQRELSLRSFPARPISGSAERRGSDVTCMWYRGWRVECGRHFHKRGHDRKKNDINSLAPNTCITFVTVSQL